MEETKSIGLEKIVEMDINKLNEEWSEKYLRLYADFDNYKKRAQKEKEDIRTSTKIEMLSAIMDIDSDLHIAEKSIKDKEGVRLIISKLDNFLKSHQIERIQTTKYDPDLHEVISVLETGEEKIIDVVSRGYFLNGKPVRYPKIILSK